MRKTWIPGKTATKYLFLTSTCWNHQWCLCGKSNIWVCFQLICEIDIKKDRPAIPMALCLCLCRFLPVLLIKTCALHFFHWWKEGEEKKTKKKQHHARSFWTCYWKHTCFFVWPNNIHWKITQVFWYTK